MIKATDHLSSRTCFIKQRKSTIPVCPPPVPPPSPPCPDCRPGPAPPPGSSRGSSPAAATRATCCGSWPGVHFLLISRQTRTVETKFSKQCSTDLTSSTFSYLERLRSRLRGLDPLLLRCRDLDPDLDLDLDLDLARFLSSFLFWVSTRDTELCTVTFSGDDPSSSPPDFLFSFSPPFLLSLLSSLELSLLESDELSLIFLPRDSANKQILKLFTEFSVCPSRPHVHTFGGLGLVLRNIKILWRRKTIFYLNK